MADEAQLGADHYEGAFALLAELTQHFAEALELDRTLERSSRSRATWVPKPDRSGWSKPRDKKSPARPA